MTKCPLEGKIPQYNSMCQNCSLFLETCLPISNAEGYAINSENDCFLCIGCGIKCELKELINL